MERNKYLGKRNVMATDQNCVIVIWNLISELPLRYLLMCSDAGHYITPRKHKSGAPSRHDDKISYDGA
jgi:hypothetical protein